MKQKSKIVLCGGPTSGKTSVLQHLKKMINPNSGVFVSFVDEVASIHLKDVREELLSKEDLVLRQIRIFRTQVALEEKILECGERMHMPTVVICDRGLHDMYGYLSMEQINGNFTKDELAMMDDYYDSVYYLEPMSADKIPHLMASNAARVEHDAAEILAQCEKTRKAWFASGLNVHTVRPQPTISQKAKEVARMINDEYHAQLFIL